MSTPDAASTGFLADRPDPLRYGNSTSLDSYEVPGMMSASVPIGARVLDIGSGGGASSLAIVGGKAAQLVCVEPDAQRAQDARARGIEVCEAYFDTEVAQKLGKFDVVILGDVLEHLSDPSAVLVNLRECLTTSSIILASVPNVAHWTIRLSLLFGRFNYTESGMMDATHLRWFTRRTFRLLFESLGYEIDFFGGTAGLWMPVYSRGALRFVPARVRRAVVLTALRAAPSLFACQHLVCVRSSPLLASDVS